MSRCHPPTHPTPPQPSELKFVRDLHKRHKQHPYFASIAKKDERECFRVRHFAGEVTYTVHNSQWLLKNGDSVPEAMAPLLSSSSLELTKELFHPNWPAPPPGSPLKSAPSGGTGGDGDGGEETAKKGGGIASMFGFGGGNAAATGAAAAAAGEKKEKGGKGNVAKKATVSSGFVVSMRELTDNLKLTKCR